jgi:hypothetical protein
MALNHWNKQCAIAASHVNNPSIVLERVTHNQRAVDSLREALHGIVEQPGGVRACCEPGPYIGAKDVAKCMVARTNGMRQRLPCPPLVIAEDQKCPCPHRARRVAAQSGAERREAILPIVALVQYTGCRESSKQPGERGCVRPCCGGERNNVARCIGEMIRNSKLGSRMDKTCCPGAVQQAHHGAR